MQLSGFRRAASWLAPGALVIAAALAAERALAPSTLEALSDGYPYAVFGTGILLAWRFHRSRVAAALLALVLATHLLDRSGQPLVAPFTALLLSGALAALSLLLDRGVLTLRGLAQIAAVPVAGVAVLVGLELWGVEVVNLTLAAPGRIETLSTVQLPRPELAAFALGLPVAVSAALVRGKAVEKGMAWAMVATFLAFVAGPGTDTATLYLGAAGVILTLSVIETSYGLAYRDELTGLPARRALPAALAGLGRRYAIAMVDVDHFKRFNDRHGHEVGDQVLRMVAKKLGRVGGGGQAFRYGGEEFAVVFAGKSREEAVEYLEALRSAVAGAGFILRGRGRPRGKLGNGRPAKSSGARRQRNGRRKKVSVTVSIGVAERTAANGKPEEVLRAADKALYRAKRAGRNRVAR